jgi:hypothetical protein
LKFQNIHINRVQTELGVSLKRRAGVIFFNIFHLEGKVLSGTTGSPY